MALTRAGLRPLLPGVAACAVVAALAWALAGVLPGIPWLTAAVGLGILLGQLRPVRRAIDGRLGPGVSFSSRTLMRAGIVLLGLQLSLTDVGRLGPVVLLGTVLVVALTFAGTYGLGRLLRLPGRRPLLLATGFAICGASAIGAVSAVVRPRREDQADATAMVTLCGTLAIAVLPALQGPLSLDDDAYGHWVGASVHDVGQVVAAAQVAGAGALGVALVVKLTRVLMLAPLVAGVALVERRRAGADTAAALPPLVPLFVAGFIAAVLVRSFLPVPEPLLGAAMTAQTVLLAVALVALGSAVRLKELLTTGWRSLAAGLGAWVLVAALAFAAVLVS